MPSIFKRLYRGVGPTSSTTLYTTPTGTKTLVNSLIISNSASATATYTVWLGASGSLINLANAVTIPGNDAVILELKHILEASEQIVALVSASTVNIHISGLEIT